MRTNRRLALSGSARRIEAETDTPDPLAALLPAGNPRCLQACSVADLARIGAEDRVLVLGAARRGVDAVLALDAQGHRGIVRLVSPHGLLLMARESVTPEAAERLAALRAAGRLEVCAGWVRGADAYGDTFVVDVLPRGRTLHSSERYQWIVNCTARAER